jgi:hypothetical protein
MSDEAPSTSSSEIKTGREADSAAGGFREMPPNNPPPEKKEKEFTAREAGEALASKRTAESWPPKNSAEADPVFYTQPNGERADPREAISLERAASDLAAWRAAQEDEAEKSAENEFAKTVDKLRKDEGLDPETAQLPEPNQPQLEQSAINNEPSVPGLDAEVTKALSHPQIRQAIEEEMGKATQLQTQHTQQIELANHFAQAAFLEHYPDLQALPLDQVVPALRQMARTNPQRFKAAIATLERVGQAAAAQHHFQQQRAAAEKASFDRYAAEQDAAFERMRGNPTLPQKQAVATEMVSYAKELGVDRNTLVHLLQTNPIMRHSAFQKMIHDAVEARIAKREAAKYRDKLAPPTLPHVNKPGNGSGRGVERGQADLAALSRALTGAKTQNDALKAGAALLAARRKGR